jgi:hypothetical protein
MANKYRAWAAGEQITAANLIDFIQKNVVVQCDAVGDLPDVSTRREGMAAYDMGADSFLIFSGGATSGWTPPWNLPWGLIAYATGSGASAAIGGPSTTSIAASNSNFPTITYPVVSPGGASAGSASAVFNGAITATKTQNRELSVSVNVVVENTNTSAPRDIVAILYAGGTASPTTAVTFSRQRVNPVQLTGNGNSMVRASINLQGTVLTTTATTYLRLALYQTTNGNELSTLSITYVNASVRDVGPNGSPVT